MIKNNFLERSFGPVSSSAGIFMFIIGLYVTWTSLFGLILVVLGAFAGFTSNSSSIDFDKKRVRFSDNIFGIIKTGKWLDIDPSMKIGFKSNNKVWRAFSRSNRPLDVGTDDFLIVLCNSHEKEIMPLKKAKSLEEAYKEYENIADQLGLSTI